MLVMGIVNVTPDSFSDGGRWESAQAAIAHGHELVTQGAEILDIGGESTRPGATQLSPAAEWQRIAPVLAELGGGKQLAAQTPSAAGVLVSVDTYHAQTARQAVMAGATIVNDVTGGQGDPQMFATVAELGCDYILQHGRGNGQSMNSLAHYSQHVVLEVREELLRSRDKAVAAGIAAERIILDPGLGFAKMGDQDWGVLAGVADLAHEGHRILIGASRKRFLEPVSRIAGAPAAAPDRDLATAVISALLADLPAAEAVWAVRVHNVAASVIARAVVTKMVEARQAYAQARAS